MNDGVFQKLFRLLLEDNTEELWCEAIHEYLQNSQDLRLVYSANGWSLLHYASENLFSNVVALLLEKGGDVNISASNGSTPYLVALDSAIDSAIQENSAKIDFSVVELLIQHGADIDVNSVDGISRNSLLSLYGIRATKEYYKCFPEQSMN